VPRRELTPAFVTLYEKLNFVEHSGACRSKSTKARALPEETYAPVPAARHIPGAQHVEWVPNRQVR
jgi:hypothetical protein